MNCTRHPLAGAFATSMDDDEEGGNMLVALFDLQLTFADLRNSEVMCSAGASVNTQQSFWNLHLALCRMQYGRFNFGCNAL